MLQVVCFLALVVLVSSVDVGGVGATVNNTISTVTGTLNGLPISGVLALLCSLLPAVCDVLKQHSPGGIMETVTSMVGRAGERNECTAVLASSCSLVCNYMQRWRLEVIFLEPSPEPLVELRVACR
ncbi:unnamed protein product [Nippostrongylus brasiliensis]|uniref:Secreted protein n=1 Tax=Nippostrongylus brasiliensis TaxID=27835 RepID=A0A0N4YEC7_NIPBR|nr:unnamed protein product [Nippostrongylus brasiliensis]